MGFIVFIVVVLSLGGSLYLINLRSQAKKRAEKEFEHAKTFEEKMIILQKASLKRLVGIETTLNFFFWFFVIGLIIYFLYYFMAAMPIV